MNDVDITILGGGPVGSALALLLARAAPDPSRIVLCRPAAPAAGPAALDPRALALNHGSRLLLQRLGAWPEQGAPIDTIHVSQRGRLGRTVIRHSDFDVPELGSVHAYDRVQRTLHQALAAAGVRIQEGLARIASETADGVTIAQVNQTWSSGVAVQAEGGGDTAASEAVIARDYDQHAVLALVRASRPRPGWAWERFTQEGPLALLPIRTGEDAEPAYSLVWCCAPAHAQALAARDDAAFGRALSSAFGERLGVLTPLTPRQVFPLRLRWRRDPVQGRRVAVGNAAQTLHPVAGQGLNLGLRDADRLAQTLAAWLQRPGTDPRPLLASFAQARRPDRTVTAGITDLLPRVFASGSPLVEHACGLALLALDTLPPLRRPLARQLMQGLRG